MENVNVIRFTQIPENALAFSLNAIAVFNDFVDAGISPYVPWQLLDEQAAEFEPIDQWILQTYPELKNTEFVIYLD